MPVPGIRGGQKSSGGRFCGCPKEREGGAFQKGQPPKCTVQEFRYRAFGNRPMAVLKKTADLVCVIVAKKQFPKCMCSSLIWLVPTHRFCGPATGRPETAQWRFCFRNVRNCFRQNSFQNLIFVCIFCPSLKKTIVSQVVHIFPIRSDGNGPPKSFSRRAPRADVVSFTKAKKYFPCQKQFSFVHNLWGN